MVHGPMCGDWGPGAGQRLGPEMGGPESKNYYLFMLSWDPKNYCILK